MLQEICWTEGNNKQRTMIAGQALGSVAVDSSYLGQPWRVTAHDCLERGQHSNHARGLLSWRQAGLTAHCRIN